MKACRPAFFKVFNGCYGSNRPMKAFQAVSSSIETVLMPANSHNYTIEQLYLTNLSLCSFGQCRYSRVSGDLQSYKYQTSDLPSIPLKIPIIFINMYINRVYNLNLLQSIGINCNIVSNDKNKQKRSL
jgi:hypothetical protein